MNLSQLGYMCGYEIALEKVGFCDPELLEVIKTAGGVAVNKIVNLAAKGGKGAIPAVERGTVGAAKTPFRLAEPQAVRPIGAPPPAEVAMANPGAAVPGAVEGAAPAAAAAGAEEASRLQKAHEWFKGRTRLEQGLMAGGAGLGMVGLGAGIGHASSR